MRVVVTGAAGFIGSHVAEAMAAAGHEVVAVDRPGRAPIGVDLAEEEPPGLAGADVVVHLAGRPGVRSSWGDAATHRDNVETTRRLLDACAKTGTRVILASSSSVYGSADRPCAEDDALRPESPYGHSKRLAEDLARAARVHTVILRFFSVYGPRQRPDMAFHRFFTAALSRRPLPVFGDGSQSRAFTFVDDVVAATMSAAAADLPSGIAINVGHPVPVTIGDAARRILALAGGEELSVTHTAPARGDVTRTWAATERAERLLGWTARTDLDEGLKRQLEWHRNA
ncbi:NAD-dependent epimerase/dehydratase family protein [Virgisporangium aurantiacum]|uniref:Putative UDP-glucose epimerase YtcB n=1 Tax=Virgisporangium aurantiacum TaxID=175570 RepID=A0A8J3Z3M6_9ACTN|nr:NAD-dependent epimerase/dehydratase family protein [Virgisporangium aurantiacum]GIJ55713.1 putative UDP-glucose epimerase YtcB [Virgisporangium aurantiacum]